MSDKSIAFKDGHGPCRFCGAELKHVFADLGMAPPCQSQVSPANAGRAEAFFPLIAYVCERCHLVQVPEFVAPADIFTEYAYFSSFSDTWVAHVKAYAEHMMADFGINSKSKVMELASNDGYLLQWFVKQGVTVLGIEPAANVAKAAEEKGVPTLVRFFGTQTADEVVRDHGKADLLLGNNVLAHVPDLMDFVAGMKKVLAPGGVITMEFPHLQRLMERNQLDTIYHEHYSYFSFIAVEAVFAHHGITLFDVAELTTHGGSIRIYGRHAENAARPVTERAKALRRREEEMGYRTLAPYLSFNEKAKETKRKILETLIGLKRAGKKIAVYGAAGKTNTLLNYCGIRRDFVDFAVDKNPYKQGNYMPGSRIPIYGVERLDAEKPDYLFIGVWNLKEEILAQTARMRDWGGKWILPIPTVEILD